MKSTNAIIGKTFTTKKIMGLFVLTFFLALNFIAPVSASNHSVWYDQAYNFDATANIWVKRPVFTYDFENITLSYKDKTKKYSEQHSEQELLDKIYRVLQKKTEKLKNTHFSFERNGAGKTDATDLILAIEAKDLGWIYRYYPAYSKYELVVVGIIEREIISADGKKRIVKEERKEMRRVYYPEGYNVWDSAAGKIELIDAKTGKVVWRYTDTRDRSGYDSTGPESMFGRIISNAYDKMKEHVKMK